MPSGRKKKHVDLELQCEWEKCTEMFTDIDLFLDHVKTHIDCFMYENSVSGSAGDPEAMNAAAIDCRWRLCPHFLDPLNTEGCERHIYYHAYHTKLKCRGAAVLQEACKTSDSSYNNKCFLDSTSRNTIPELPERLSCHWGECEYVRDNSELFYRHVNGHTLDLPPGPKVEGGCACQWAGCTVMTANRYKMGEHLHSHTQERAAACPSCGGLFSNATKLIDHVRRQAVAGAQQYQCCHCNKEFPTERLLRDHVRHHVNVYKCLYCDMTCPHPSGLRTHILYRHTDDAQFKCPFCKYRAKLELDLHKHIEIHNDAATYSCPKEGCTYVTKTSEQFVRHARLHALPAAKKFACHVCEEIFPRGTALTHHLKDKHKFSWPSGHCRFRYTQCEDSMWRLQTVRYESMDVTEQQAMALPGTAEEGGAERLEWAAAGQCNDSDGCGRQVLPTEHLANLEMLHDVALHSNQSGPLKQ